MLTLGFLVEMEAKPGREDEVAAFLKEAKALVDAEPGTVTWFACQIGPTSFRIFDTFADEDDRQFHLAGKVRQGLDARADLFATPPRINPIDLLTYKMPA
ncbi:antibiotic biosynthesis monooxygenase [Catellatospora sp. NPDC049609]|uniref:putative quinol monooxygenase n=1 Tax=Catellatospora sp. NPDC049609 TaxID=3155505 RepID=UPI00341E5440